MRRPCGRGARSFSRQSGLGLVVRRLRCLFDMPRGLPLLIAGVQCLWMVAWSRDYGSLDGTRVRRDAEGMRSPPGGFRDGDDPRIALAVSPSLHVAVIVPIWIGAVLHRPRGWRRRVPGSSTKSSSRSGDHCPREAGC